jgi:hypothetical protein
MMIKSTGNIPVVQMLVISLGAIRSVSWVRVVVVLPAHVHEAWDAMVSVFPKGTYAKLTSWSIGCGLSPGRMMPRVQFASRTVLQSPPGSEQRLQVPPVPLL